MVIIGMIYIYLFKVFIGTQMPFIHENKLAFVIERVRNVFVTKSTQNLQQLFSMLSHSRVYTYPSMTWKPYVLTSFC